MRGLRSELDEAKRKASRLSQEHREFNLHLEDAEKDKETLKQTINQLEETKQQQERALEKLNKEVRWRDLFLHLCSEIPAAHYRIHSTKISSSDFFPPLPLPPCLLFQYESLTVSSREEEQALRVQLEEQRERARKEMQEAQRHGNDAQSSLDRSHINLRRLEDEVCVFVLSAYVNAYSFSWPGGCFYYENDM